MVERNPLRGPEHILGKDTFYNIYNISFQVTFIALCRLYGLPKNGAFPNKYKHTPNITPANVAKHQTNLNDTWRTVPCKDSVLP